MGKASHFAQMLKRSSTSEKNSAEGLVFHIPTAPGSLCKTTKYLDSPPDWVSGIQAAVFPEYWLESTNGLGVAELVFHREGMRLNPAERRRSPRIRLQIPMFVPGCGRIRCGILRFDQDAGYQRHRRIPGEFATVAD